MSRRVVRSAVAVLALMAASAAGVVSAGSADAATCLGAACDRQNPYGAGCAADGEVIYDDSVGGAAEGMDPRVRLWYSPSCGAVWASIYNSVGPDGGGGVASITRNSDGLTLSCQVDVTPVQSTPSSCYTNMLDDLTSTAYASASQYVYFARTADY
jgi:hypothetical protein